jgi:hypothetical protein
LVRQHAPAEDGVSVVEELAGSHGRPFSV